MEQITLDELHKINLKKDKPVVIMTGLPYSGKTTFRKELLRIWRDNRLSLLRGIRGNIISSDDCINKVAREENKSYQEVWKSKIKAASSACDAYMYKSFLDKDVDFVIIDKTHQTPKSRLKSLTNIPNWRKIIIVQFKTLSFEETCRRRKLRPEQVISEDIYLQMLQTYIPFDPNTEAKYYDYYLQL